MAGCDAVVHFAAESHVDRSIYEPAQAIETNITGTFILLQVARELKIRKFVHISTDEVYGDLAQGVASDETFPLRPSSPYSASKASSDLLVGSFVRTFNFPGVITRASNNYGPYQFPEKFVPLMIMNALDDKPCPSTATVYSSAIGSTWRIIAVESWLCLRKVAWARSTISAGRISWIISRWFAGSSNCSASPNP